LRKLGTLLCERGVRLRERNFERRAVDLKQRRAGSDRITFVVEALLEYARHACTDFDLLRAFSLAHDVEFDRHAARGHRDDLHRNRRRNRRSYIFARPPTASGSERR
jgi:hypothetical protein